MDQKYRGRSVARILDQPEVEEAAKRYRDNVLRMLPDAEANLRRGLAKDDGWLGLSVIKEMGATIGKNKQEESGPRITLNLVLVGHTPPMRLSKAEERNRDGSNPDSSK
jgi:hypothetical protein